jgi:hypothetical protein
MKLSMFEILPSYVNEKYDPFNNSLPDIIAVFEGVKPMARLSCKLGENYVKFLEFAKKRKIYAACVKQNGNSHIYISKSKKMVDFYKTHDPEMKNKPTKPEIADFAKVLGYPKCCVENYLDKSQKEIVEGYQKERSATPLFYFNNLLHSISNYYLSFHLPCSLKCEKTKKYNRNIFKAIEKVEPELARRLKEVLGLPLSVWYNTDNKYCFDDRAVVLFDGILCHDEIEYSGCSMLRTNYPNNKKISKRIERSVAYIKLGNKIERIKNTMRIYRDKTLVHAIINQSKLEGVLAKYHG